MAPLPVLTPLPKASGPPALPPLVQRSTPPPSAAARLPHCSSAIASHSGRTPHYRHVCHLTNKRRLPCATQSLPPGGLCHSRAAVPYRATPRAAPPRPARWPHRPLFDPGAGRRPSLAEASANGTSASRGGRLIGRAASSPALGARFFPACSLPGPLPPRAPLDVGSKAGGSGRRGASQAPVLRPALAEDRGMAGGRLPRGSEAGLEYEEEVRQCRRLVAQMGRGLVYLGSSRILEGRDFYGAARDLSREAALLLGSTTWSGIGSGLMDAVAQGALEADRPVAGLKVLFEANQEARASYAHPYLPVTSYLTCRSISARKMALVDAGLRMSPKEQTAYVALPGGVGTLDEIFHILALIQLKHLGSPYSVPFLLMNYGGYYSKLLDFLNSLLPHGTVAAGEVDRLWRVFDTNAAALEFLTQFYSVQARRDRGEPC